MWGMFVVPNKSFIFDLIWGTPVIVAEELKAAPRAIRRTLRTAEILLRAFDYAADAEVDRWQMAVELPTLIARGLTIVDIRWMLARRFVEHNREITPSGAELREFESAPTTVLCTDTCISLTSDGAKYVRLSLEEPAVSEPRPEPTACESTPLPIWDRSERELWYAEAVVKRYRVPAPNQEMVLVVFQEEGWPCRIDDPLPPVPDADCKRRLQATIKSLNRSQIQPSIRFHGNGCGTAICWKPSAHLPTLPSCKSAART
ncbi:hypothetical protein K227x_07730 [Rubripirellula lacrimiformis]|uniref:Uncharacterized protein n=2 Tax=Rubripirellula lacrimiformis TaxID=1930273 RepID=A0A517N5H8_9BACT|nr:hypothetical protein K227x_07730 [Rubripirellula lacrimiformis]